MAKTQKKKPKGKPVIKETPPRKSVIIIKTSGKRNYYIFAALILIVTFISFLPSLKNQIDIWDDYYYLMQNHLITSLSWDNLKAIFTAPYLANYHPLTILSYAVEYNFFKFTPFPYHLNNIILHLLNTLLIFIFIHKLTSKLPVAIVTALLFGIHPLHVESVTWVSERKDVLYTFFFIIGLITYLNYKKEKSNKYYILTIIFFIFSCLSKGMAVTFSVILVLIDYLLDKKLSWSIIINKIPFIIISLIFGIITIRAQAVEGAVGFTQPLYSTSDRFFLANYSFFFYIHKMLLPINLSGIYTYPHKVTGGLPLVYLIAPVFNALFLFLTVYSKKYTRRVIFGSLFFLVSIFPVLQILSVGAAIAADRYFYISSIGLFFLVGIGFNILYENKQKVSAVVIIVIIALTLSYLTYQRTKVWKTNETFWGDVIIKNPRLELGYFNQGAYYYTNKNFDAALNDFNKALEIYPDYADALRWRAKILADKNENTLALIDYNRLIKIEPNNYDVYLSRGTILRNTQQYDFAINDFNKAIQINPKLSGAYMELGIANTMTNNYHVALTNFNKAVEISPKAANVYSNRGNYYSITGKYNKAIADYNKAIEIEPNNSNTYYNRSVMYKEMKDYANALKDAMRAQELGYKVDPGYIETLKKLN